MDHEENLTIRLLHAHQELMNLRTEKLRHLRSMRDEEKSSNLAFSGEVKKIEEGKWTIKGCCVKGPKMCRIEVILSEIAFLSNHISKIEKELNESGCYDY